MINAEISQLDREFLSICMQIAGKNLMEENNCTQIDLQISPYDVAQAIYKDKQTGKYYRVTTQVEAL